jgi:hypothetical protein
VFHDYGGNGASYDFATGRSGYAFRQVYSGGEPDGRLDYYPPESVKVFYASFWAKYTGVSGDLCNSNNFYPHIGSGSIALTLYNTGTWLFYTIKDKNGNVVEEISGGLDYPVSPMNGSWHHFEYYVNLNTGVVKHWFDRQGEKTLSNNNGIMLNKSYGSSIYSGSSIVYIAMPGIVANSCSFTRLIDDWEVWDGMPYPGGNEYPAISIETGCGITTSP